jgi:primosomal protein N' (replication factor Y)
MNYWEIVVLHTKSRGASFLTYQTDDESKKLEPGSIVEVEYGSLIKHGVCIKQVSRPSFPTKNIIKVDETKVPAPLIQTAIWAKDYYRLELSDVFSTILPRYIFGPKPKAFISGAIQKPQILPSLTDDQEKVLKQLKDIKSGSNLLIGETGSGKTRVYFELLQKCLDDNKSALLLVPQIAISRQLERLANEQFGNAIVTINSQMSDSKRRAAWHHINQSDSNPIIVIGPRSALFSPIKNLGLIIIDEAHDSSFKQDSQPHYDAVHVAATLAKNSKAPLILGTATPNVSDLYVFQQKRPDNIFSMPSAVFANPPIIELIDQSKRENFSTNQIFSNQSIKSIMTALERDEKSIVLLNRRGTASNTLCGNCGWIARCENCDLPMTLHADIHKMICHNCDIKSSVPSQCPDCNNSDIIHRGVGTKKIVGELKKLFPTTTIGRYDQDRDKNEQDNYRESILVGTQVLAQGLDIATVSNVVVVSADTMLYIPDYTSVEKTFHLLKQVSGRAGRTGGRRSIIIQSNYTKHPALQAVVEDDVKRFFDYELGQRKQANFPPFQHLLKITIRRKSRASAKQASEKIANNLAKYAGNMIGPAAGFYERKGDWFEWHIIIRSPQRRQLQAIIDTLPSNCHYVLDPSSLL